MPAPFRTATGQTRRDAYLSTASQIANAQRHLDNRMRALLTIMHDEAPDLFYHDTDYHPQLTMGAVNAAGLVKYIQKGQCGCDRCERGA